MGELVQPGAMWGLPWGLLCGTSVRKDLCVWCLVIVVIFMGFEQAGAKRCGGCLKVINWRCVTKRGLFSYREDRFSLCNTAILWNFIASPTGYCKRFYWIPLFTVLLLLYVFEVGKAKSAIQSVLMILTVNGLFQEILKVFYFTLGNPRQNKTSPLETPHNRVTPFRNFKT